MPTTILNVSNRLPVTVTPEKITKSSGGLVAALEGVSPDRYALQWIGWPGGTIEPARQDEVQRVLVEQYGSTPVFLTEGEIEGFYEGFSNSSLWPLLHYMPSYMKYESAWWEQYEAVNRRFADAVLERARDGDMVWVHDYQLMLLPAMLKAARPSLRIGFFLHTPFPSYEVFRRHPRRTELLRGMLGADLVGFHTFGYLRHFRSAVLRVLGIESEIMRIPQGDHDAVLGVFPIGINAPKFEQQLDAPEHQERIEHFRHTHAGKRVVLSVERMDYTKGILHRLDAVDAYLRDCDHAEREAARFVFVAVPSREGVAQYKDLRAEVEACVGRVNGRYATLSNTPIHFIHGSVPFADLCAMYAMADAAVVTPLMDGMNLVAKEYVACQRDDPAGALVLSEFAGAAEELFSALIVNPYDAQSVAEALRQALRMPPEERRQRMAPMRRRVVEHDAGWWARSFIGELEKSKPRREARHDIAEASARLKRVASGGRPFALFLDYDGTLRELEREPAAAGLNAPLRALLDGLARQARATVTIISGRTPGDLDRFVGDYPFALVAEHGASLRRTGARAWERLDANASYAWKEDVGKILRLYESAVPGAFIEDKRTSLVWHYRKADPEFGRWKANELVSELTPLLANEPLEIRHGKMIVEVTASAINKGGAVRHLLGRTVYELIVCAGDDVTDESMFRLDLTNHLTVKVGDGPTEAQYRVPSPAAFRRFLEGAMLTATESSAIAPHVVQAAPVG